MKRIYVCSVFDAFEYVMAHYAPFGMEGMEDRQDSYAVISIQDTHTGGFGIRFTENQYCKGVLTLYFDDIVREVEGAVLFDDDMAEAILAFAENHLQAETLLVHCYAGQSRSKAVGTFLYDHFSECNPALKLDASVTGVPNPYIYDVLENARLMRMLRNLP